MNASGWLTKSYDEILHSDSYLVEIGPFSIILAIVPIIMTLGTIIGNILVLTVISYSVGNPTKLLIANLAVADLFVGIVIMPFAVSNILTQSFWIYGPIFCKIWISMDVICCTASIVTLCAISGDRFIGVTKPLQYARLVTRKRVLLTCFAIWILSISVLMATVRWSISMDENFTDCFIGDQLEYVVQSTIASFFIPLGIICILYYKIFQVASRSHNPIASLFRKLFSSSSGHRKELLLSLRVHYGGAPAKSTEGQCRAFKKQRKTAKILGIVVGAFICCWTPFFILHSLNAIIARDLVPGYIMDIFTWLGYFNSMLNPLIYGTRLRSFKNGVRFFSNLRVRSYSHSQLSSVKRDPQGRKKQNRGKSPHGYGTSLSDSRNSNELEKEKVNDRKWKGGKQNISNSSKDDNSSTTGALNDNIVAQKLYKLLASSKTTEV